MAWKQEFPTSNLLTLNNPVLRCYAFWTSLLIIKMLLMAILTSIQRFRYKAFANSEDILFKNQDVSFNEIHVERVRRAHRNDLENVLPFIIIALLYILTDPQRSMAINLIELGSTGRILYTLAYAFRPVPQPARFVIFYITWSITIYMAGNVLFYTAIFYGF